MKSVNTAIILSSCLFFASCLKEKTKFPDGCDIIVSYSLDIQPIINTSCVTNLGPGTGCHDSWIFEYTNVKTYLDLGVWQNEVLIEKSMPEIPNYFSIDSLTSDQIQVMRCWINQGYPKN